MARFEASTVGTGVVQSATGDVQASQPFTIAGGPLYAAETGGTTLSGGSLITNASGELPGWLDPDTDSGIYTLTIGTKSRKFVVGDGASARVIKDTLPYALLDTALFSGVNIDAALTQAKADLGAAGGRIILPLGDLEILSPPSFAETRSVVLEGGAGLSAGAVPATRVVYKGTAARGIDARSSFGFGMRDFELRSDQAGFTGDLIDFDHSIAQDAAYAALERCRITSAQTNCTLVNFENAILLGMRDCYLTGGSIGIQGRGAATYSNSIKLDTVTFFGQGVAPIKNPGEGWTVIGCGFEALSGGVAGAILCDQAAKGLAVVGGWCGDATAGTGTWFDLSGEGLQVLGGRIGGGTNGVRFSATSVGCSVLGGSIASMTNGVTFTSGCQDIMALGIGFFAVTNQTVVGGTPRGVWMDDNGYISIGGRMTLNGDDTMGWYKRTTGCMKTDVATELEIASALRTFHGGANSVHISDVGVMALGSNTNQALQLDSKGTGRIQFNTANGATGGTQVEATGGKVGFYGTAPIAKQTGVATDAASIHAALVALGLIAA